MLKFGRSPAIRLCESGDLDRILAIEIASFGADAWDAKTFQRYFKSCRSLFFVIKTGRRIAGYSITCVVSGKAELDSIAVDPRNRHKGLARMLLGQTVQELRSQRVRMLHLMVAVENESAIRFYERYGFKTTKRVRGYYGRGRDGWHMKMRIHSAAVAKR